MTSERKTISIIENKYYDLVIELLNIYEPLYKLYQELAKLEKKGLKDSEEYNNIYNLISHFTKKEIKIVKKFDNMVSNELQDLKDQIAYLIESSESELTDITDLYTSNKYKRLLSRIRDYGFLRNDSYDLEIYENEEEEEPEFELMSDVKVQVDLQGKKANIPMGELKKLIDKYSGVKKYEPTEEEIEEEKEYDKASNRAWYQRFALPDTIFYKKIEEEIEKTENPTIKNLLIDYKYNLIYSSVAVENRFAKEKDSRKWTNFKHLIELLAEIKPDVYENNYTASLEYEIKQKVDVLTKKQFDPSDKLDLLDNKIDMMYIKSLIDSLISVDSHNHINENLNVAYNEKASIETKNHIMELKNTTKQLKLKK